MDDRHYAIGTLIWAIPTADGASAVVRLKSGSKVEVRVEDFDDLRGLHLGKESVIVAQEQDRGAWAWRLVTAKELLNMAEPIIDEYANDQAAMAWSTPDDSMQAEYDDVLIVADFGGSVAVNGSLGEGGDIPEGFEFVGRMGGKVPTTEEEVPLDGVADKLAFEMGLKEMTSREIVKKMLIGKGKGLAYRSVSGETEFYGKPKVKENPVRRKNPGISLKPPFVITARLLPGLKIGDSYVSMEWAGVTSDNRAKARYYIDTPKWEHRAADLRSGVGGGSLQSMFESLLSFLGAAAEAYGYEMRTRQKSENADLFPPKVTEWAYQHSDEIDMLGEEIRETPDLIVAAGNNPGDDEDDDFDLNSEMESGYVISDTPRGGLSVSREGKHITALKDMDDALLFIARDMDLNKYWPNVFYVNDHGNVDLLALTVRRGKNKKATSVKSKIVRSWV